MVSATRSSSRAKVRGSAQFPSARFEPIGLLKFILDGERFESVETVEQMEGDDQLDVELLSARLQQTVLPAASRPVRSSVSGLLSSVWTSGHG